MKHTLRARACDHLLFGVADFCSCCRRPVVELMMTVWRFLFHKWYAIWNGFENACRIVQPEIEIKCVETYFFLV
jgi:hypothetical protein